MGAWVMVLRVVTAVAQVVMTLSPTPDIYRVHKRKDSGEMAALPLVAMVVNSHLWLLYGYMTDSIFPLMASQIVGESAAFVFNAIYFRWSSQRKALLKLYAMALLLYCVISLYAIIGGVGITQQTHHEVGTVLGYVGVVINIWMFASPLATLKKVVTTKSVASLPINLSIMIFVSCALWMGTAIVDNDLFVLSINLAGVLLSTVQIIVYVIYHGKGSKDGATELQPAFALVGGEVSIVVSPKGDHSATSKSPVYQPLASPLVPAKA